ncbi:MAG TPA: PIN domain-containing protein [Thermoanaerobaculia bacterium]|nr:PIN domain-containing protein [Thermoanaerobaculia bacterium]
MNDRVFLDTNIFVYLYDSDQPDKQARARALVERFGLSGEIVISTQVLQEFYACCVTRKFARQLSEEPAEAEHREILREALLPAKAKRPLKELLLAMPLGGEDADFEREVRE